MDNIYSFIAFGFAIAAFASSVTHESKIKKLQKRLDELEK